MLSEAGVEPLSPEVLPAHHAGRWGPVLVANADPKPELAPAKALNADDGLHCPHSGSASVIGISESRPSTPEE